MSKAKIEKAPALNLPHDFELIAPFVLSAQYGITDEKGRALWVLQRGCNGRRSASVR
ncbi:MAG: hypothetical protein ACMV0I_00785 [Pseudomonas sp.]